MTSPFPTLAICLSYTYFVKVLGPRIMDSRKPMNLQTVLIVYNFVQVVISAWLFSEVMSAGSCVYNVATLNSDKVAVNSHRVIPFWQSKGQSLIITFLVFDI